jgi:hypothetical protein
MAVIFLLEFLVIYSIFRASRHDLENALPVFAFFVVLMPLECKVVIPGLCDVNTMRFGLITLLVLYFQRRQRVDHAPIPMKSLMLAHVGWAICSTLYSLSVATSLKQLISQVLEYYLLYFLFVKIVTKVETLYSVLFAVCMAMLVCCCFSLVEAYAQWSILRIFPSNFWITYNGGVDPLFIEWGRGLRVRSTFPHPILFGDALVMCIPISLYLLSIWEDKRQRRLLWMTLLLMLWAIYKTSSRGPWLAMGLSLFLLFFMVNQKVRKYLIVTAVLGLTVAVSRPGIWETVAELYQSSTDPNTPVGASYLYRDTLNQTIQSVVAKDAARMMLGYGLGTFRELGLDITFLGKTQRWYTCDNNWALFLYEIGYVGLFLIVLLLSIPIWIAFHSYRCLPKPGNRLSGVLLISLAAFYFLLMSVAGYSWGQQGYLTWILISLVVCHSRLGRVQETVEENQVEDGRGVAEYDLNFA